VIHQGVAHIGEWEPAELRDCVVGSHRAGPDVGDELLEALVVHRPIVA
jgi:hypothetical protein